MSLLWSGTENAGLLLEEALASQFRGRSRELEDFLQVLDLLSSKGVEIVVRSRAANWPDLHFRDITNKALTRVHSLGVPRYPSGKPVDRESVVVILSRTADLLEHDGPLPPNIGEILRAIARFQES